MTARLTGTKNEVLTLDIGPPDESPTEPGFVIWGVSVSASLPDCWPPLTQSVESSLYHLPDVSSLEELLGGNSSARFEFDVLNFKLEIFEHTLNSGPRYGYVVDCHVYSNNVTQISDWDTGIADQLLHERWDGAMSTKFAFLVGYESLKSFHKHLRIDIRERIHNGG